MDDSSNLQRLFEDAFRIVLEQAYEIMCDQLGEDHPKVNAIALAMAVGATVRVINNRKPVTVEGELAGLATDETRLN